MAKERDNDRETRDDEDRRDGVDNLKDNEKEDNEDDNDEIGGNENEFKTVGITDLRPDVIQSATGIISEFVKDGFILKDSTGEIYVDAPGELNLFLQEEQTNSETSIEIDKASLLIHQ